MLCKVLAQAILAQEIRLDSRPVWKLSCDAKKEALAFSRYEATMIALLRMHYGDYVHKLNSDHIHRLASSTSLRQMSCWRQAERCLLQKHAEALVQHTVRQVQAAQIDSRALANVAYGAARCGRSGMISLLFAALAIAAERRLSEFKTQELANTAWAFATVNRPDEKLFTALARAAVQRVSGFKLQELANMAWAFATVKRPDEKLFTVLARAA